MSFRWILLLSASLCTHGVRGTSIDFPGASSINCDVGSDGIVGPVEEGYSGNVEVVTGIPADTTVRLVAHLFPDHIKFLELDYTPGDTTATVRTKMDLDADALKSTAGQLYYSIMCVNLGKLNNTRTLKITDLNDNSPIFEKKEYSTTVSETFPLNTEVLKVKAVDADVTSQNNRVSYSILPPVSLDFDVRNDGGVMLIKRLNYNTAKNYNITIKAEDNGGLSNTATVLIEVTDFDNMNPYFDHALYKAFIQEEQTGAFSIILPDAIKAQDADTGINMTVVYSISAVTPSKYLNNFDINENSGVIAVVTGLDREEIGEVTISIKAAQVDDNMKTANAVVTVTIEDANDNPPVFDKSSYHATLLENSLTDTIVFRVKVTDLDEGGFNGTLRLLPESVPFSVSLDGTVTVKTSTDLDRETVGNFIFQIEAQEANTPNRVVSADVNVTLLDENDNSPLFGSSKYEGKVFRNQTVGMLVATVEATDPDAGLNGLVKYYIDFGNLEGYFSSDTSGEIRLLKTIPLEENKLIKFSLYVAARDGAVAPRSSTVLVEVLAQGDSKPQFLQSSYHGSVEEEREPGVTILKVGFYAVTSVVPVTLQILNDTDKFALDSNGEFTTKVKLDYETQTNYFVGISISDGTIIDEATVLVRVKDVNDNPPRFSQESYDIAVSENLEGGSSIFTLEVTDVDEGGFSNGHFVFNSDIFDMNKQGFISLRTDAILDRETKANYLLQVTAVDQPLDGLNSTAQLNITVLDYNDNTPQFIDLPDPIFITEGDYSASTPGEVHRIMATDSDMGANAEVTISLSSPSTLFQFREDGTLLVVGPLDRETKDVYELVIVASDNGTPRRQNLTTIRLSVTDMNDNTPVFSASIYSKSILVKDAKVGDVVLTLLATDKDIGNNSLITYSFSAGMFTYLSLNNKMGVVTIASDLADVTEDTALDFTVMAQDHGLPPLNSTARGLVSLMTVSLSEGVAFGSPSYNFSVAENQPEGAAVGVLGVVRTSLDSSLYGISYVLMTHTDLFTIDPQGALLTKEKLDKESKDWYILEVKAVDTRIPPTSAVALVRVEVEDVNEAPKFIDGTYQAKIFSIAPYKYPVVQVKATDPDSGDSERLQYSVSEPSSYFDVDPSTGQVYVVSAVGLAGQTTTLTMKATDLLGLQATAMVQVDVQGSASSDVVVISLNRATNEVEKNIPEMEESLGRALGWTVRVIRVSSSNGGEAESRTFRNNVETFVSIIATDVDKVIPAEEIKKKLQSESATVKAELEKVFGAGLEFDVQEDPVEESDNQAIVIALAVLLGLSMMGLLLMGPRFIRTKKNAEDSARESFAMDNRSYINQDRKTSGNVNPGCRSHGIGKKVSQEAEPEPDSQNKDNSDNSQDSNNQSYRCVKNKKEKEIKQKEKKEKNRRRSTTSIESPIHFKSST